LLHGFGGWLSVNSWDRLRGRLRWGWEKSPVFDLAFGVPVEVAEGWNLDLSLFAFPSQSLSGEIGLRHQGLYRERDGSLASSATIPRVKLQYQFSRALFLRGIFEYGSQERDDLRDPVTGAPLAQCEDICEVREGSVTNDFSIEALLSYEPTPGTVFFLGYTRQMEDVSRFRFRELRPQRDGLFLKASYRFRR